MAQPITPLSLLLYEDFLRWSGNKLCHKNTEDLWPGLGLNNLLTEYHNTEYLAEGIKSRTNYVELIM